jgi:hypothetical protein
VIINESFVSSFGADGASSFALYAGPDAFGTLVRSMIYSSAVHGPNFDFLLGFGPQPVGTYTLVVEPVGSVTGAWSADIVVASVPEPATAVLLVAGVAGLGLRRVRRVFALKPRA